MFHRTSLTFFKNSSHLLKSDQVAPTMHDCAVLSARIEFNAVHDVAIVVAHAEERHPAVFAAPVRHAEGQNAICVGEVRKATRDGRHGFVEEVLEVVSRVDGRHSREGAG